MIELATECTAALMGANQQLARQIVVKKAVHVQESSKAIMVVWSPWPQRCNHGFQIQNLKPAEQPGQARVEDEKLMMLNGMNTQ